MCDIHTIGDFFFRIRRKSHISFEIHIICILPYFKFLMFKHTHARTHIHMSWMWFRCPPTFAVAAAIASFSSSSFSISSSTNFQMTFEIFIYCKYQTVKKLHSYVYGKSDNQPKTTTTWREWFKCVARVRVRKKNRTHAHFAWIKLFLT